MEDKQVLKGQIKLDNTYAKLPHIFFSKQVPSHVPNPKLVVLNCPLAEFLGLNSEFLKSNKGVEILAGNRIFEDSVPIAQAYAGHQFGHFTMLGDGRALLLGEHITPYDKKVDIQLKGSGRTPYSRGGDGKAALGPMLREYIISEAMNSLGIPTTRSLAVVTTGESIMREECLPGAILTRVASSHLRVGTFQFASRFGDIQDLKELADYAIDRHFSNIINQENKYLCLLREVVKKQARLIAKWQLVGFIHGVMNTDNMTISGETIDYGPCAFMNEYNPNTVFSSIDIEGRYSYGNQPKIAQWNLARYAETLLPLIHDDENEALQLAQREVSNFSEIYQKNWFHGMLSKLGIFNEEPGDESLVENLLIIMNKQGADYTNTFRQLTLNRKEHIKITGTLEFDMWYKTWQERLTRQTESSSLSKQLMQSSNPAIIPRNHVVEEALEAAVKKGDYGVMNKFLKALSKPYEYTTEQDYYSKLPNHSNQPYRTFCGT